MFIIIDKYNDSVIAEIGTLVHYDASNNPIVTSVNGYEVGFAYDVNVIEINEIPNNVTPIKWCYTEEQGFYPNPNWHEPSAYDLAPQDVVDAIIDEYTNELVEMGVL